MSDEGKCWVIRQAVLADNTLRNLELFVLSVVGSSGLVG